MGAIDFGIIVDATVIMVENIFRHLADASHGVAARNGRRAPEGMTGKIATIYFASSEVTKAIFFAATIIIAGFLPLFTLSGVEGHIFGPMAKTYAYALIGRPARHLHRLARAGGAAAAGEGVGDRDDRRARAAAGLRRGHRGRAGPSRADPGGRRRAGRHRRPGRELGRARVPAQARGGQHLDARRAAALGVARRGQRLRQPHARPDQGLPRGRDRRLPARHGRTTAPIPTASPTASSSWR